MLQLFQNFLPLSFRAPTGHRPQKLWIVPAIAFLLSANFSLLGCANPPATSSNSDNSAESSPASIQPANNDNTATTNMENHTPRLEGTAVVEMIVKGSPVTIEVDGKNAPVTAGNFVDLVERGFYNGLTFHRVVKTPQPFVAQGGDPQGTGTGGFIDPQTKQSRYVPLELKLEGQEKPLYGQAIGQQAGSSAAPPVVLKHKKGAIAMARSQMPNSASSQFYFALSDLAFLDGDYAVFGHVTKGMDAVTNINQGDRIDSVKVISGAENLKK
jgi:peptidyl-prolyl cis-trans isomerase B (cyclophilin B)